MRYRVKKRKSVSLQSTLHVPKRVRLVLEYKPAVTFVDVIEVLYDVLLSQLSDSITNVSACGKIKSTLDSIRLESRWSAGNAIECIPLLCKDGNQQRKLLPLKHAALIGYERTVVRHNTQLVHSKDLHFDTRWFLGEWANLISLTNGDTSIPSTHPVGGSGRLHQEGPLMWSMNHVERHFRHVSSVLEGKSVPRTYKSHAWMDRIQLCSDHCSDLDSLPLKVQTFVANARSLFTTAYHAHVESRNVMFGKCSNRVCGRIFYRGMISDTYGANIHSDGAIVDILADHYPSTRAHWKSCAYDGGTSQSQIRRFCSCGCYQQWRSHMNMLLGTSRICMHANPSVKYESRRLGSDDLVTLSLSQALRRNARLYRTMREAMSLPLPRSVRQRDRDDVILQLMQVLNVDIALVLVAAESNDHLWTGQKNKLPGGCSGWRCGTHGNWDSNIYELCEMYRSDEPDCVLTSLMTMPTFFQSALRNTPRMFRAPQRINHMKSQGRIQTLRLH